MCTELAWDQSNWRSTVRQAGCRSALHGLRHCCQDIPEVSHCVIITVFTKQHKQSALYAKAQCQYNGLGDGHMTWRTASTNGCSTLKN